MHHIVWNLSDRFSYNTFHQLAVCRRENNILVHVPRIYTAKAQVGKHFLIYKKQYFGSTS